MYQNQHISIHLIVSHIIRFVLANEVQLYHPFTDICIMSDVTRISAITLISKVIN